MIIALENARRELIDMRAKLADLGSALRVEDIAARVAELEQKTADPSFWSDPNSSRITRGDFLKSQYLSCTSGQ